MEICRASFFPLGFDLPGTPGPIGPAEAHEQARDALKASTHSRRVRAFGWCRQCVPPAGTKRRKLSAIQDL
jgi:hypothetical protein